MPRSERFPARRRGRISWSPAAVCFILTFLCQMTMPFCDLLAVEERTEHLELIRTVQKNESVFLKCSAEIATYRWNRSGQSQPDTTQITQIVQWDSRFHETSCLNDLTDVAARSKLSFLWQDGITTTMFLPPDNVEQHTDSPRKGGRFQPYSTLLSALGYEGTLSEFLRNDSETIAVIEIKLLPAVEVDGVSVVPLRRSHRLPGSQFVRVIDLDLAVNHAYLPCRGRLIEREGDADRLKAEAMVPSFRDLGGGCFLMSELRVSESTDIGSLKGSVTVQKFEAVLIKEPPPADVFQATEFVGNPNVARFRKGELISNALYREPPVKRREPWPPIAVWLAVNGALFVAIYLLNAVHALPALGAWTPVRKIVTTELVTVETGDQQ